MHTRTGPAVCLAVVVALSLPPAASAADVILTFRDGRVTLVVHDVSLRQVLAEWETAGRTWIVNRDRIPQVLVNLELVDVPESQALATLLQPLTGYMAAHRPLAMAGASAFDRIYLMPTLAQATQATAGGSPRPPAPSPPAAPGPQMPGRFGQPSFGGMRPIDAAEPDDADQADVADNEQPPVRPQPGMRSMPPGTVPPDSYPAGSDPTARSSRPTTVPIAPGTAAVPGMMTPAPRPPEGAAVPPPRGPGG